jgi:hypothetical protein
MVDSQLDDDLFDKSPSHGEENEILLSNEVELNILANVECRFNIVEIFSHIATNLGIECNNLSIFKKRHGWQGVYHHIPIPNLKNIISTVVPLQKGGSNRGDKNCSSSSSTNSIEGPKVSSERCLT